MTSKAISPKGSDGKKAKPSWPGVQLAYRLAREQFVRADQQALCRMSGGELVPDGLAVALLGERKLVALSDGTVTKERGGEEPIRTACLVVQYLLRADGRPLEGVDLDFRALPSGFLYIGPFSGRSTGRLAREFGKEPSRLHSAAETLDARFLEGQGDLAFEVDVLPRVPLKVVLWQGDEEFAPSASILFDSSVEGYLDTEGAAIAAEILVTELVKRGRALMEENK